MVGAALIIVTTMKIATQQQSLIMLIVGVITTINAHMEITRDIPLLSPILAITATAQVRKTTAANL
jgi:hypothetical protein